MQRRRALRCADRAETVEPSKSNSQAKLEEPPATVKYHQLERLIIVMWTLAAATGAAAGDASSAVDAARAAATTTTATPASTLRHDYFLLGSGSLRATDGLSDLSQQESTSLLALDILADLSYREIRLLGEYVITSDETELERLQLGWEPNENLLLWLGRYHQPSSYWNQRYHHGQYLQTAVTKPRIEEWEDTRGLLPQHMVGMLLDSTWQLEQRGAVDVTLGLGIAPALGLDGLDPYSLLHHHDAPSTGAYNFRIDYRPMGGSNGELENSVGLLLSHNEIELTAARRQLSPANFSHIDQNILGAYVDWRFGSWRTIGTIYYVEAKFDVTDGYEPDHFAAAYLEIERPLGARVTTFSRLETFSRTNESRYLSFFPERLDQRLMAGVRWDYARKQALKLELASVKSPNDKFWEMRLEWSVAVR